MPSVWWGRIRPTGWAFLAGLGALACGGGDDGGGPVDPGDEPVASVTITPGQATIAPAEAVTLTATVKDASGTVLTGRAVTWSANHPDLASVSTTGVVTGQADGVVLVTATRFVRKDSIGFTEPGEPDCEYTGTLAGDPPTGGSGGISCVGTITGLGSVNLVGTWQITR